MKKYHFIQELPLSQMDEMDALFDEKVESITWFERYEKWFFEAIFQEDGKSLVELILASNNIQAIISVIPEQDWLLKVYEDFPPLEIGAFYVYGSHIKTTPPPSLLPLLVDAATAFGSGHHESTFGCLQALTHLKAHVNVNYGLDMGCGSGILAMAMASLWKNARIKAVDNDLEAVRVTAENAKLNKLNNIEAFQNEGFDGGVFEKSPKFDLICANILASPLIFMAPLLARTLDGDGFVVLAGLLATQEESVLEAYIAEGLSLYKRIPLGVWVTLVLRKNT